MLCTKDYNALELAQPTNFKAMLQSGELLWGTGCRIPSEESARIVATLPHHFCFIDTEHTPINATLLSTLIRTIQYTSNGSMVPFVRVPETSPELVNYALNAGAGGIVVAHVQSAQQAKAFVRLAKFPPIGDRSYPPMTLFGPQTRTKKGTSVYDVWNSHAAVFCQVEDVEGVKNVAEIAKVVGVDGLMVGASDLRFSLGLPAGSPDGDEPVFIHALNQIQRAADSNKLAVLGFAVTPEIVRKRLELGWRALICHADASGIFKSGTEGLQANLKIAEMGLNRGQRTFTLYGYERNPRSRIIRVVAKAKMIDLNLVEVIPRERVGLEKYKELFPMSRGKIPGFEGPNGFKLTETLAIATYLAGVNDECDLLGDGSSEQKAEVLSWMSWANEELLPTLALWFLPLIPFSHSPVEASSSSIAAGKAASEKLLSGLEEYLGSNGGRQYLVHNHITLADIMVVVYIGRGLEWVLDANWRDVHKNIMRHFHMLAEWPPLKSTVPTFRMVDFVESVT